VVSHDRWFLNRVCTHILAFEDDGKVEFHVGDFDRYLEKRRVREQPVEAPKEERAVRARARKLSYKEQRELEAMEAAIHNGEAEVSRIEGLLQDPEFFVKRSAEFPALEAKLREMKAHVAGLYDRWQELEAIRAAS
jgi:ATP-binding cassette subfamily F protein uup